MLHLPNICVEAPPLLLYNKISTGSLVFCAINYVHINIYSILSLVRTPGNSRFALTDVVSTKRL